MSDVGSSAKEDAKKSSKDESDSEIEDDLNGASKSSKNSKQKSSKKEKSSSSSSPKKSTQKPPPKKSVTNKSDEDDEDDEDDDDDADDKKVALLDQPLEVSGSRERKKVERFSLTFTLPSKEKKADIPDGTGIRLGDIALIEFQIQKTKADDLKVLHKLLFNRPGNTHEIKRNLKSFNGFNFEKSSPEYEKKRTQLDRLFLAALKQICEVLALERSSKPKEELVTNILEFLLKPEDLGKAVPKKKSRSKRGQSASKKSKSKGKPKRNANRSESESEGDDDKEDEEEAVDDEEEEENLSNKDLSEDSEDSNDNKKKKKPAEKKNKAQETKHKEKVETKPPIKSKAKRKLKEDEDDSGNSSDSDNEMLSKKAKRPPTDDELKTLIKKILDGANLEEITMKTVCKQVYAAFPDFELSDRKKFIKDTVRSIIS